MSTGFVPDGELDEHLDKVSERQARGFESAYERAQAINNRLTPATRARLYQHAMHARTVTQRIHWLRQGAQAVERAADGAMACQRGCAHCCHIPVLVSETEAKIIGREIGRSPTDASELSMSAPIPKFGLSDDDPGMRRLVDLQAELRRRFTGVACTFLSTTGDCSIYEYRPLACRHLINLDDDDLLCRLVPNASFGPPYLDARQEQGLDLLCMGAGRTLTDIRDWFPSLSTTTT